MRRDILAREHKLSERQAKALGHALEHGSLTIQDYEALCPGINRRSLQRDLKAMLDKGLRRVAKTTKSHRGGLEPPTFGSVDRCRNLEATQPQGLTGDASAACTKSADSETEPDENRAAPPAAPRAEPMPAGSSSADLTCGGLTGAAMAEALAMLARLPLSDTERVEAVRRLLADR